MKIKSQNNDHIVSVKDDYIISIENSLTDDNGSIFIRTPLTETKIFLGVYTHEKAERVMMEIDDALRIGYDYWMPKEDEVYVPYL